MLGSYGVAVRGGVRFGRMAGCQQSMQWAGPNQSALRHASSERRLEKSNWKHGVVYLYQYPRTPYLANPSPFCLKLETYLRANNVKHEVSFSLTKRSERGKMPFVELNGEQISDSQVIIWRLQKQFGIEDPVSGTDRGPARALERMIEMSTMVALQQDRVVKNAQLALSRNVSGLPLPAFITNILAERFKKQVQATIAGRFDKLNSEEIREVLRRDIRAVNDILGEKKFLFGDRITVADCAVFGQLATAYYLPYRQHVTDLLDDEYPVIKKYLDRIRIHYFQDWQNKE